MKIDIETGDFELKSGLVISGELTRAGFLASAEGSVSEVFVCNTPFSSYRFKDIEDSLLLVIYFERDKVQSLGILKDGPVYGVSWDDWTKEKEMQRKKDNEAWLKIRGLTDGAHYPWGDVYSVYDEISGYSRIMIGFRNDN